MSAVQTSLDYQTSFDPEVVKWAEELVPVLAERAPIYDRENRFPAENFADLHQAGLLGILISREEGGLGASYQTFAAVARLIARGCASTAMCFVMHAAATKTVSVAGTTEQKARYLRPVLAEGKIFSVAYSEPGAGSNFLAPQIVSRRATNAEGQTGYLLNGEKFFATSSGTASFFLVNTQVEDPQAGQNMNILVVEVANTAGTQVRESWDAMGMRGNSSNDLIFENCFVAESNRLGEHGQGLAVMRARPQGIPMGLAAVPVGIAEAAFEYATEHARTRTLAHNKKPLSHLQAIRFMIAEMKVATDAARLMLENAARTADENPSAAQFAMIQAKYLSNVTAVDVCNKALQVCGGRGYFKRNPVERYLRDSHAGGIMASTLEGGRDFMGKVLLGLDPAGPE